MEMPNVGFVYVRDDLAPGSTVRKGESIGNIEYLILDIPVMKLTLIGIYRPPHSSTQDFERVIGSIVATAEECEPSMKTLVLTGDLNLPIINWQQNEIYGGTAADRRQGSLLMDLFEKFFMEQMVLEPTRINNILDLFATNDGELVSGTIIEHTRMSDHNMVKIVTNLVSPTKPSSKHTETRDCLMDSMNLWV